MSGNTRGRATTPFNVVILANHNAALLRTQIPSRIELHLLSKSGVAVINSRVH